ncbi:MAG: VCBS repeat-containing protein, partial [Planctomycetaceae bacterium]
MFRSLTAMIACTLCCATASASDQLERIPYNNPGLVVDLGVGLWAWPLPMDYDGDGDLDLVVSCPDKPYTGIYFFENPGNASDGLPVFKPAVRLCDAIRNVQISYVGDDVLVMSPGVEYRNFRKSLLDDKVELGPPVNVDPQYKRTRANQWKSVDYDADGDQDLIIGLGVWDDYGWDDAWDKDGNWTNGPLHGFVYLVENTSSTPAAQSSRGASGTKPTYAEPVKLTTADGDPIDVYGMPSPNLADFDNDGDLDLICGEFMDGFTYFENTGSRRQPTFATGRRLQDAEGTDVRMDLQMITPVAVDWDSDGDIDLISGDEDGRVAFIENVGKSVFQQPVYFQQEAADVKFG